MCYKGASTVGTSEVYGRTVFILLTNDFPKYIKNHSKTIMYADTQYYRLVKKTDQLEIDCFVALTWQYITVLTKAL